MTRNDVGGLARPARPLMSAVGIALMPGVNLAMGLSILAPPAGVAGDGTPRAAAEHTLP